MDYEKIIHAFVDSFVENPDSMIIRQMPSDSEKDVVLLIVSDASDTARLIGRKGSVADALREVMSIAWKLESKIIHLKFEAFEDEKDEY